MVAAYHRRALAAGGGRRAYHEAELKRVLAEMAAHDECQDCGTPLSDPVSVARRRGPRCHRKAGQ